MSSLLFYCCAFLVFLVACDLPVLTVAQVKILDQEAFESLIPGKYLILVYPKNCRPDNRQFGEYWEKLDASIRKGPSHSVPPSVTFCSVECEQSATFCEKLVGSDLQTELEEYGEATILAVRIGPNGDIVMERFFEDLNQINVNGFVKGVFEHNLHLPLEPKKVQGRINSFRPSIALLMLSQDGLGARSDIWCRFLALSIEQGVDVLLFLHDASYAIAGPSPLCTNIPYQTQINRERIISVPNSFLLLTQWGTNSLVKVIVFLLRVVIAKFDGADRYIIVSESTIPLVDPKTMLQELSGPGYISPSDGTQISVFQKHDNGRPVATERLRRYQRLRPRYQLPIQEGERSPTSPLPTPVVPLDLSEVDFHVAEMWAILSEKAGAWFAENEYFGDFEMSQAPDETYFISLCTKFNLPFRLGNPHRSDPNESGNDLLSSSSSSNTESHGMYTQWSPDAAVAHPDTLEKITEETIEQWSQGQKHSFLFARKISEETEINLPWIKNYESSLAFSPSDEF